MSAVRGDEANDAGKPLRHPLRVDPLVTQQHPDRRQCFGVCPKEGIPLDIDICPGISQCVSRGMVKCRVET